MLRLNFNLEYMEIQSRRILKMVTNHFINQVQWLFFRNLFLLISEFQELNVYQPKRKLNLLHSTYPNFTRMINNSISTISFKSDGLRSAFTVSTNLLIFCLPGIHINVWFYALLLSMQFLYLYLQVLRCRDVSFKV